jgi:hypothetical protein
MSSMMTPKDIGVNSTGVKLRSAVRLRAFVAKNQQELVARQQLAAAAGPR